MSEAELIRVTRRLKAALGTMIRAMPPHCRGEFFKEMRDVELHAQHGLAAIFLLDGLLPYVQPPDLVVASWMEQARRLLNDYAIGKIPE